MSYSKERKEKNCLNCNAEVQGKFCHICGQQNSQPKESFGHLVNHFFQDLTHFDGKFFSTIKLLIFKPGFLTLQYTLGKRTNYLNPIRLYVFTNTLFFLIFFTFIQKDDDDTTEKPTSSKEVAEKLNKKLISLQHSLATSADKDSAAVNKQLQQVYDAVSILQKDPASADSIDNSFSDGMLAHFGNKFASKKDYDSLQHKLPASQRDNWLFQKFQQKILLAKVKYNGNYSKIATELYHKFKHRFPQILFLSLPFFGLTLKVLYLRQKKVYYVDHLIFSIHFYCAIFILLLAIFASSSLEHVYNMVLIKWINIFIFFGMQFYLYKAMRNFYLQRRGKTIVKYILLNLVMLFVLIFLIMGMLVFTAFQI